MRKVLSTMLVVFVFTALGSKSARADTIVETGRNVTAIDGIMIAGTTYDLTFTTSALTTYVGAPSGISTVDFEVANDLSGYVAVDGIASTDVIVYNTGVEDYVAFNVGLAGTVTNAPVSSVCTPGSSSCLSLYADFTRVSEIDPNHAGTALALIIGALLVIRGRRRKMTPPENV